MSLTRATSRVIDTNFGNTPFSTLSAVSIGLPLPGVLRGETRTRRLNIQGFGEFDGGNQGNVLADNYGGDQVFVMRRAGGTPDAPTAVQSEMRFGGIVGGTYGTTQFGNNPCAMNFYTAENQTDTTKGSFITFDTTTIGQQARLERVRITDRGNVVIGNIIPTNPALSSARLSLNTFDGTLTADHLAFGNGTLQYPIPINYTLNASIVGRSLNGDYRLHIQDGSGRVNHYWNAYTTYFRPPGQAEELRHIYTVTGEGATRHYMGTNNTFLSGEFAWYGAPPGIAGQPINWLQLGSLTPVDNEFGGCWFSPRGIYSDFFISNHAAANRAGRVGINTHQPEETLDVNGTLHLRGGTAQYNPGGVVQAANLTNAYISFGPAGSVNDWCCLRQTGGENNYVLSFDFHDDGNLNPAGQSFAIRNVSSSGLGVDTIQTNFFINNLGNVGIGTGSPIDKLNVSDGTANIQLKPIGASSIGYVGMRSNHAFGLTTNDTERVNIEAGSAVVNITNADNSQNPAIRFRRARGSSAAPTIVVDGTNLGGMVCQGYDGANYISSAVVRGEVDGTPGTNDMPGRLIFGTTADGANSPTERMRIDRGGYVNIGTGGARINVFSGTTDGVTIEPFGVVVASMNGNKAGYFRRRSSDGEVVGFLRDTSQSGWIYVTTTACTYNSLSDHRLKNNPIPFTTGLNIIKDLQPVEFTWKSTGLISRGFLAHELQAVVPEAVTGEKDAVDENGNPQYQGVDASKLVPYLVSAVKELTARVASLESSLAAFEQA